MLYHLVNYSLLLRKFHFKITKWSLNCEGLCSGSDYICDFLDTNNDSFYIQGTESVNSVVCTRKEALSLTDAVSN